MLENKVTPKLANSTHEGGKNLYQNYLANNYKIPHIKNVTYS